MKTHLHPAAKYVKKLSNYYLLYLYLRERFQGKLTCRITTQEAERVYHFLIENNNYIEIGKILQKSINYLNINNLHINLEFEFNKIQV